MKKVIIYPVDGTGSAAEVVANLRKFFASPLVSELVAYVKFNDVLHIPGIGPNVIEMARDVVPADVKFFIDLKIGDVSGDEEKASVGTVENTLKRYAPYAPGIVTVSAIVSAKTFKLIRPVLPETKLALFSLPTDMSAKECEIRNFGLSPSEKIAKDISDFQQLTGIDNPFDMVVCSPKEVASLKSMFGDTYQFIVPGIRSSHMNKDHQVRTTSAYDALKLGADLIVMGAQLSKGNQANNISPEESQRLTFEEIQRYFDEL